MMSAEDRPKMHEQISFLDPNTMAEVGTSSQKDLFSQTLPNLSTPPLNMAASEINPTNSNDSLQGKLIIKLSVDELSNHHYHHNTHTQDISTLESEVSASSMDITRLLDLNMGNSSSSSYNNNNNSNVLTYDESTNWDSTIHELQDVGFSNNLQEHHHHHHHHQQQQPHDGQQFQITTTEAQNNCSQNYNSSFTLDPPPNYHSPNILLHLHQPLCSSASSFPINPSSFCITNPIQNTQNFQHSIGPIHGDVAIGPNNTSASSVMNDHLFQLNQPPPPPHPQAIGGIMFQPFPHGYPMGTTSSRNGFLFGGGGDMIMEGNNNGVVYHGGDGNQLELDFGVLEFNTLTDSFGVEGIEGKGPKVPSVDKQRREELNGKYRILRNMIPNPTKVDRASVVGDAIEYIRELIRTVNELKLLVEKKRRGVERSKRQKTEDGTADSIDMKPYGDPDGNIRTSWLKRKSKDSEVDVRIIDDEVTLKMVQRKKINFLLFVSKVLDELQLDLHHAAGGHVGEYCSFLFNSKIIEGSSVYASAIVNRVIEIMDTQYAAAIPHTSSC